MYDIIRSPVITEKATRGSEHNQVIFQVPLDATKPEIKAAVEGLFGVKVDGGQHADPARARSSASAAASGQRSDCKKAIVTLAEGQTHRRDDGDLSDRWH